VYVCAILWHHGERITERTKLGLVYRVNLSSDKVEKQKRYHYSYLLSREQSAITMLTKPVRDNYWEWLDFQGI
jgi:hypothetical protein